MIGVDIWGGDAPPKELLAHLTHHNVAVIAPKPFPDIPGITFIEADDVIGMDEDPLIAIRKKRRSTMAVGLELLRDGKLFALVSTGNTGALLGNAIHILNLEEGIKRPGLLAMLPTAKAPLALIDVGANLIVEADHLVSFAHLGIKHQEKMGVHTPKVGILNIGSEAYKGRAELVEAYALLQKKYGNQFVGNIEGRDVFTGRVDVLVTDGFTGNILLKTAEGMAEYIHKRIGDTLPGLESLVSDLDYAEHPGAVLAGVDKIVIKCHGSSDSEALLNGIAGAEKLI